MTNYKITEDYIIINKRRFEKSIRSRGVHTPFEIYLNKTNHEPHTIATFTDENAALKAFSELQPELYNADYERFYVYSLDEYEDGEYNGNIDCKTTPCERVYSVIFGVGCCPINKAEQLINDGELLEWEHVDGYFADSKEYRYYDFKTAYAAYDDVILTDARIDGEYVKYEYKLIFDVDNNECERSDISDCNLNFMEVDNENN